MNALLGTFFSNPTVFFDEALATAARKRMKVADISQWLVKVNQGPSEAPEPLESVSKEPPKDPTLGRGKKRKRTTTADAAPGGIMGMMELFKKPKTDATDATDATDTTDATAE